MASGFDSYAKEYRDIIDRVSGLSGEKYEFFIRFRVERIKNKLAKTGAGTQIQRILDLGCGIGVAAEVLKAAFPLAAITGIDSSQECIAEARRLQLSYAEFIHGNCEALPVADSSVDLVYSNGVFHHIIPAQRPQVLRELFRIVRPAGQIFIFENNPANFLMMRAMAKNPFDAGIRAISPKELLAPLKSIGFRILQVGYYFFFPHFLGFLRRSEPMLEGLPLGAQYFIWAERPDKKSS